MSAPITARITEIKGIDVWPQCIDSPVYLVWFLPTGGLGSWCFGTRQQRNLSTKETGVFAPFIDDLETAESDVEVMGLNVQPSLLLGAEFLHGDHIALIESLLTATRVLMLINNDTWQTEGPKWQTVRVNRGSFKILMTDMELHSIEMVINLPQLNQQAQ